MKPKQGVQARLIAGSVVLALTLSPLAVAQDATPSPAANAAASQSLEGQLPDSPGAVQTRPSQPALMAQASAQADNNQAPSVEQAPTANQTPSEEPTEEPNTATAPDAAPASSQSGSQQSSDPTPAATGQSDQSSTQPVQSPQAAPPQAPREPVGTAAAESIQTTGVAASRPAGAAVAPAKQRRVRSILIKVGALVGVGVAVGTTMALTQGSPSRPPGAH